MSKHYRYIAACFLILFLSGCGSKKKVSARDYERTVYSVKNDVVLTRTEIENARILTDSIGKRTIYSPVDPDKPSRVGNTIFENATITQEDTDLIREEIRSDTTTTDLQDKSKEKGSQVTRSRETDVKDTRWPWWAWFAIAASAVIIFVAWIRFGRG